MNDFYPIWWDTTLTIYNRFKDAQTQIVTWYRHTVSNCFWKYTGNKISVGNTVLETNNTICRIPDSSNFLPVYEWVNLPNDLKSQYFTLSAGDIIINGEVEDTIDEYTKGYRATDLLSKYKTLQGCIEIQQVAINTGLGRGSKHYYVTGV